MKLTLHGFVLQMFRLRVVGVTSCVSLWTVAEYLSLTWFQRIVIVTIIEIEVLNKMMIIIVKQLFYDHKEDKLMKYSRWLWRSIMTKEKMQKQKIILYQYL